MDGIYMRFPRISLDLDMDRCLVYVMMPKTYSGFSFGMPPPRTVAMSTENINYEENEISSNSRIFHVLCLVSVLGGLMKISVSYFIFYLMVNMLPKNPNTAQKA